MLRRAAAMLVGLTGAAMASPGFAQAINGTGNPLDAIPGGTQITFDAPGLAGEYANPTALTTQGVTFLATSCYPCTSGTAPALYVNDQYGGYYNTTGYALQNTYAGNAFEALQINFATPTSAFAFNWGAANTNWTLSAYGVGGNLLDSFDIAPTGNGNDDTYDGMSVPGISYVILSVDLSSLQIELPDYVFVDNFTYATAAAVPEPWSLAMFGMGVMGLGIARRRGEGVR